MRTITTIKAKKQKKPRIGGYVRVSRDSDDMEHSYEAQIKDWEDEYGNNDEYEFVRIFGDYAKSGHNTKREDFAEMVDMAKSGELDIIVTKSISRFGRHLTHSVEILQELKEHDVEVRFAREGLSTKEHGADLIITLYAIVAEFELVNMSEAVKHSHRYRIQRGSVETFNIYGYDISRGKNRTWTINEEQAAVVRQIFALYLAGHGAQAIALILEGEGHKTFKGGTKWSTNTIMGMLENEKYVGDARSQKSYTDSNFKSRINRDELPQVYIDNNHEAIIDRETFDAVQREIAERRKPLGHVGTTRQTYDFTGLIKCGCCGAGYRHRINKSCRRVSASGWTCTLQNSRGKAASGCDATAINGEFLKELFTDAYNEYITTDFTAPLGEDHEQELAYIREDERWVRELYDKGGIDYPKYTGRLAELRTQYDQVMARASPKITYIKRGTKVEEYSSALMRHIEQITIGSWIVEFEFKNTQKIVRRFKHENRKFKPDN